MASCSELVDAIDWSATALGPRSSWPPSLRAIVDVILHSRHPMFLWWGPELIQIYNDAYVPSFGVGKHPAAMGQRGADCWQEIWPIIWPQIDDVMTHARASWNEDQLVPIFRNGRIEDVYWTYGYSPVFLESGEVGGTLVVCTETTQQVVANRRLRILRDLGERMSGALDPRAAVQAAAEVVEGASQDIPFALFYSGQDDGPKSSLVHAVGLSNEERDAVDEAARKADTAGSPDVSFAVDALEQRALLVQALEQPHNGDTGSLALGVSSRLPFDPAYRAFLVQVGEMLFTAQRRITAFAQRAAIEAERRNLLMQAPVGMALMTGPEHRFELANAPYVEMVGREVVGRTYLEAFPELAGTPIPKILDRVYERGEPFVTQEQRVPIVREGREPPEDAYFRFNLEPLRDASGAVYGMMAVSVDITELVRSRRVLEQAHVEREKLLEDLQSASRAKDEFLAMLGHELRNPLSPIVTAVELIKMRSGGRLSREEQVIERQVDHLGRLVDDLLDVSKITRGKIELKKETIELSEVLARAVEIASDLLEKRRHTLSVDVPRTGALWHGDPVRLAQVVGNLLNNAARYTEEGGNIVLHARREGGHFVIRVIDDGIGISPTLLPIVFDLFVQAKRSKDRTEGGLGLGLTLVKNLVSMHGGTVEARSEGPGKGSEFIIRLPAELPEVAASTVEPRPSRDSTRTRRVLVVDDNEDAAELLALTLRARGHEVQTAHEPLAALECLDQFEAEVAILDIGLPVMDGYELAHRMREVAAECRFIALTGYGRDHDLARSTEAGFERHFVKPVDLEDLLHAIGR